MTQIVNLFRKYLPVISVMFTLIWLSNLASTDAYFSVYTLIAFLSFYLQIRRYVHSSPDKVLFSGMSLLSAAVFSFLVLMANYPIFTQIGDPALIGYSTSVMVNIINSLLSFIGGIFAAYPIFALVFLHSPKCCNRRVFSSNRIAFLIFGSILLFHLCHLFFVEFPGNLTEDSFAQIAEMTSGKYSNFNTYWHTVLFRGILSVGYSLFSDINTAVSVFVIFQLLILVFAFTCSLVTMMEYGIPKWMVVLSYCVFALIPYNMALSITVWKDVLFAGACLMILTAWIRIRYHLGAHSILNYVLFAFGSLLFLIARTNGWIIYLVTFLITALFNRRNKHFLALMGILAAFGWFLLNPALTMLGVKGDDLAESLSIPIQQVSRVIADGGELTPEEESLLQRIVDLDEVSQLYTNWLSDPMKVEVRSKDYGFFQEHISDYGLLWFKLGLRYPASYVKAWVDQTKGYWNAGYDYSMYSETITDNPYGVEKTGGSNFIATLFRLYFGLSRHVIFFEPLHSIGLHVWIFLLCLFLNIRRGRDLWMCSVPLLLLLVGLWFGTPVYCCFRYVYPLFVSMPLIVSTSVWTISE